LAETLLKERKWVESLDAAREALRLGEQSGKPQFVGNAWRVLGVLATHISDKLSINGEAYDAERCYSNRVSAFKGMSAEVDRARTLREWALLAWHQNDKARGDIMWQEALSIFSRSNMKAEVKLMATYITSEPEQR